MEERANDQFALQCAKRGFHFGQLHILFPKICSTVGCQIGAQQIGSLSGLQPLLLLGLLPPDQACTFSGILHRHFIKIGYLRMRSLNAAQPHKHLAAILHFAVCDALLKPRELFFDLGHKAAADGFLFPLPPRCAAQDVGLFATRDPHLFNLYFRTDLFEIILEQFLFELLELAARCAHQILSAALADGYQVLLAHYTAIEDPYPACFPMLTLDGAQNGFDGGNIGAVPIEELIAERKPSELTINASTSCSQSGRWSR